MAGAGGQETCDMCRVEDVGPWKTRLSLLPPASVFLVLGSFH